VNLERPVTPVTRLGGHMVQGHVDAVGTVTAREPAEGGETMSIRVPEELRRYIVEKGSIAVDGVSLTVAGVKENGFTVALIPHTLAATTLGSVAAGDGVNLEVDVIAKYVESLLGRKP
jgi:riboflavin synthase